MSKYSSFKKGDVIRTNPEIGFWGIAVCLSEREKRKDSFAKCHIAITSQISKHKIEFEEIDCKNLEPLQFERNYKLKNQEEFVKLETCIGVYTCRNVVNLDVIGNIDSEQVYSGPLPFEPFYDLEITWPVYGDTNQNLGREALIMWQRNDRLNKNYDSINTTDNNV